MILAKLADGSELPVEESSIWEEFVKSKDYDFMKAATDKGKYVEFACEWIYDKYEIAEEHKFRLESYFQQRL